MGGARPAFWSIAKAFANATTCATINRTARQVNLVSNFTLAGITLSCHRFSSCCTGASRSGDSGQVADAASDVNKLLQTGTTSHATKSNGTFGLGNTPTTTMGTCIFRASREI